MNTRELQDRIIELKKKKDVCILAHAYQSHAIWEIADYTGDSFGLSQKAAETTAKTVIMCGVRFMAETVKTLNPDKKVILANPEADCPMARQFDLADVNYFKQQNPDAAVCAYINTTAELKRSVDIVVTSSSAVTILRKIPEQKILFIPDRNLGAYVAAQIPEKEFIYVQGGCPTHQRVKASMSKSVLEAHPSALLLAHPECLPEITAMADYVGSTTGIIDYAVNSSEKEFIIGTESSIVEHLQFMCPEKKFYALHKDLVCHNMRLTTLGDIYNCLLDNGGEEITLPEQVRLESLKPIQRMIALG